MKHLLEGIPRKFELKTFRYKSGYIVLDVNSSTIFQVKRAVGSCLTFFSKNGLDETTLAHGLKQFGERIVEEAIVTVRELHSQGAITDSASLKREALPVCAVSSIFLNVSHACNLRCVYCYAVGGSYGRGYQDNERLMSSQTAKAAIDYLLKNSGDCPRVSVNFFGGEPLLNWEVIECTFLYGMAEARKYSKQITFGVTTNATRIDERILNFVRHNDMQFLVSLDGDQPRHDAIRRTVAGDGSYIQALNGARALLQNNRSITRVRATLSRRNADIYTVTRHLLDIGFDCVSVGFVSDPKELSPTSKQWHLIKKNYKAVLEMVIQELRQGKKFINFLEFTEDVARLYAGRKAYRCGTGKWLRAVDPRGELYPCQRFIGLAQYKLGDVWRGDIHTKVLDRFRSLSIFSSPICSSCWARHLCGGGCPHVALVNSGDLERPDPAICRWFKFALTATMRIMAELNDAGQGHLVDLIYHYGTGIAPDLHA